MENQEYVLLARVLWFNEAKGYGLVRAENLDFDDIRVDANILDGINVELLRDMHVEVTCIEGLAGWVAKKLTLVSEPL